MKAENSGRNRIIAMPSVLVLSAALLAVSCGVAEALEENCAALVKAVELREVTTPDEVSGFGSLSFIKKVDIASPGDGVLSELPYREGASISIGDIAARIVNPQLSLAVGRAMNGVAQAQASLSLAEARLFEGGLTAESRLLGLEKAKLELEQARSEVRETERKQADLETLFRAGGVTEESVRSGRFSLEAARERLALMEKDIAIRMIGFRDDDLIASGIKPPEDPEERKRALVRLSVSALYAEKESAIARLEAAGKELDSARVSLAELTIAAPVSGVIVARYLETGERVKRDDKLLTIMDVSGLYAVVSVCEAEALRLETGMKAQVTVDGAAAVFNGTLDLVSPIADADSASFSVRATVWDPDGRLKPGMFARMSIPVGQGKRAVIVPDSAIADSSGDDAFLYVISGGKVSERRIRLGEKIEEGRVIVSGASAGEVVVDYPEPGLKEGDSVQISG